ncbi:MAG: response regulator [bacterium]|nr:response regulator [bacterium]
MLVLSRKETERILFPTLNIEIEVLRVRGKAVKIGVKAPDEIPIQRAEIADLHGIDFSDPTSADERLRLLSKEVRDQLQQASLELNQLHHDLESGKYTDSEHRVRSVFQALREVDQRVMKAAFPQLDQPIDENISMLLVEDDANENHLLASFLRMSGFEVTTAVDGCDAMDYLSLHSPPDVVLLDMKLPKMDGPALIRELRGRVEFASTRIYAMSGYQPEELGLSGKMEGVSGWFAKPLNPETMVKQIGQEVLGVL